MGNLFRSADRYIKSVKSTDIFLEIGSARCAGGSTHYFANLTNRLGTRLVSVDIDNREEIFKYIPNVQGYRGSGSQWTKDVFPGLEKTIVCLYLDNYDYNYWTEDNCQMIQDQKKEYLEKHNIIISNQDCVIEHLAQMINLLPYMSDNSIIICDDTYLYNDCWIGKCAAVVPYLQTNGFFISEIEHITGSSYGVILTKEKPDTIIKRCEY